MTDDLAAVLAAVRGRGYRNGATGAECARLSDAAAVDIPVLVAAVEAVLKLGDRRGETKDPHLPGHVDVYMIRAAIGAALAGADVPRA